MHFISFIFFLIVHLCISNAELNATTSTQALSSTQNSTQIIKAIKKLTPKEDDSNENDDDYNNESDESAEGARQSRNKNVTTTGRVGITYAWGKWDKWSKCANSCVQIKRRPCIKRIKNDTLSAPITYTLFPGAAQDPLGCQGSIKKYRICKDEKCKSPKHLRDEQCANFNRIPYREKFYNWHGYEKEHNECELFCRPIDSDIFVSMNQSVTDGVPCEKPAVYYTHAYRRKAVCVEGICKAVHTSGAIRPATTNDSQLKCGSVLCQIVSELYSKSKLSYGYNYVATIPAGAMNLTIKQMAKSDNLLALKSTDDEFILNGNNRASSSGTFHYNDDTFDYNREVGTITSRGPLSKAVILMLFVHGLNTGIKYDYTIPVPSSSISEDEELQTQWNELGQPLDEIDDNNIDIQSQVARVKDRKRRKFSWKLLGFGQCNRSCGPGVQPPIFRCIRDSPTRYYSPKRCAFAEKPVFSEDIYHCNRGLCPAYWRAADYSECKCVEGDLMGLRTRLIHCVQEQITGKVEEVAEALCAQEKLPELTETCNCPRQIRRKIYARAPDKNAKVYSRLIGTPASVRNVHNNTAVLRRQFRDERVDKAGVWLMSVWNQECSAECGTGFEHRSIYCDRTAPYTDLCDLRYTPEQKRSCSGKELECRHGVWFASEWSNCSGECFNLQRRRTVLCLLDGVVAEDHECGGSVERPKEVANCTHKEVHFCGPKWHYSEWSECSRTCGEGIQRRYAKCLEFDWKLNAMAESNQCKYLDREPVYGACNAQKCEELDATLNVVQNDPATAPDDCSDEFSNCKRINRQRLCKLQYYKTYCCLTCNGYY